MTPPSRAPAGDDVRPRDRHRDTHAGGLARSCFRHPAQAGTGATVEVRTSRAGWVKRHTAPHSPHISASVKEKVVKLSESNVRPTRTATICDVSRAAHR